MMATNTTIPSNRKGSASFICSTENSTKIIQSVGEKDENVQRFFIFLHIQNNNICEDCETYDFEDFDYLQNPDSLI